MVPDRAQRVDLPPKAPLRKPGETHIRRFSSPNSVPPSPVHNYAPSSSGLTHSVPPRPQVKKRDIAYVPADDVLPVLDTVAEVLTFYAQFVLPKHYTSAKCHARVTEVLRVMGLQHVGDGFVGGNLGMGVTCRGISGGERRLSVHRVRACTRGAC